MATGDMEKDLEEMTLEELEARLADLKARWPAHSVPASLYVELEELEEAIQKKNRNRAE